MLVNEPMPYTVLTITEEADTPTSMDANANATAETTRLDVIGVQAALSASGADTESSDSAAESELVVSADAEPALNSDSAMLPGQAGTGESAASVDDAADAAATVTLYAPVASDDAEPAADSAERKLGSGAESLSARADSAGPVGSGEFAAADAVDQEPGSGAVPLSARAGSDDSAVSSQTTATDSAERSPSADSSSPSPSLARPDAPTVSLRRTSTDLVLPETVAEVVAVVDAASRAIAAAEDAARVVAAAHERDAARRATPPPVLDLREPAQPAPVDGLLDLLAPVLERPLLVVEQPELPSAPDLMALHRAEFELEFAEPPLVPTGDEPPIPARFGPGIAVLPHIDFPV